MSFIFIRYFPLIVLAFILISYLHNKYNKKYFKWINLHWFKTRSKINRLAQFSYIVGAFFLLLSLLDLRGIPVKIETNIPDQKTIILIDTSSSMLAEDVRPNRFKKSLMVARHFIQKAVGHQISIMVFSDRVRRLVPFTDDIDFLDARISALDSMDLKTGGSNISLALNEAVNYFKEEQSTSFADLSGNLLLLTDSEENGVSLNLKIPKNVNVAVVGVGTVQGATIPMRDRRGILQGNKKFENKEVITKLDENFLKKIGSSIHSYKYWVVLSYSLPTEKIIAFYKSIFKTKLSKNTSTIRPILSKYIVVAGILFMVAFSILSLGKNFSLLLLFSLISTGVVSASTVNKNMNNEEKREIVDKLIEYKKGNLSDFEKEIIAAKLLKDGKSKEAEVVYSEVLNNPQTDSLTALFNYGTSLLKNGKLNKGIRVLEVVKVRATQDSDNKLVAAIRNNILRAIESKKNNKKNKKQNKKDSRKDKKNKSQKSDKNSKSGQKDKNKKESSKSEKKKEGEAKNKKKEEKQKKQDSKSNPKDKKETIESKENKIKQKRKMVKIPAMLKQLMDGDRKLQQKYYDTTTHGKKKNIKDW